jgi:hypothetical protein
MASTASALRIKNWQDVSFKTNWAIGVAVGIMTTCLHRSEQNQGGKKQVTEVFQFHIFIN